MLYKMALFLALFATGAVAQQNQTQPLFRGSVAGGGRACSGYFKVTAKWITWKAHFVQCVQVPYTISEQKQEGKHKFIRFQIPDSAKCPFRVMTMEQGKVDGLAEPAWEVRAFSSEEAFKANEDDLDCEMY
jgi:hypothetical protein